MQLMLFDTDSASKIKPYKTQLLKWIGNKQRFAHEIASFFPEKYGTYFEPFVGSGAVLATVFRNRSSSFRSIERRSPCG